ncbi:uncharacterized protein AB675_7292 [Cyphellophora attinorum]|uniref:F-box domain-containing protein n=1 Tax=Cyphellophora attinorum TaxID=1664694 RepID=A0A0N1H5I6_9EURO|nr:uncharacterized protein AB675_7292 [Phialophora attinorum]KPI36290.1 hypothetical protein AB675_7292 [Phialophora attinorum]
MPDSATRDYGTETTTATTGVENDPSPTVVPFRFLDLPTEIKSLVYRLTFRAAKLRHVAGIDSSSTTPYQRSAKASIMLASKLCYAEAKPILLQAADFYIGLSAKWLWHSTHEQDRWLSYVEFSTLRHISITLRGVNDLPEAERLRPLIAMLPDLQSVTSYLSPPSHAYAFGNGPMVLAQSDGSLDPDNLKKYEDIVEFGFHRALHGDPGRRFAGANDTKPADLHDLLAAWQGRGRSFEPQ